MRAATGFVVKGDLVSGGRTGVHVQGFSLERFSIWTCRICCYKGREHLVKVNTCEGR